MKRFGDENGQVLIMIALTMVALLGFLGLAADVGIMYWQKRILQAAADSGAIAAAEEIQYGDARAAAQADAALNGVTVGVKGATVAVNNPPLTGPHAGNSSYVEVIASESQPLFFLNILNQNAATIKARAVAAFVPGPYCIYTLNTSGTDFLMNGSNSLTVQNCAIIDDSSSSQAMLINGSDTLDAQSIGIVGNYLFNGSVTVTPTPVTGTAAVGNPLSFLTPPTYSSCVANPNINGSGTFTIGPSTPGATICYNGITINGSANVTLNPGIT